MIQAVVAFCALAVVAILFCYPASSSAAPPYTQEIAAACFANSSSVNGVRAYSSHAVSLWEEIPYPGDATRYCVGFSECVLPLPQAMRLNQLSSCTRFTKPNEATDCGVEAGQSAEKVLSALGWLARNQPADICYSSRPKFTSPSSGFLISGFSARGTYQPLCILVLSRPAASLIAMTVVVLAGECDLAAGESVAHAIQEKGGLQNAVPWFASATRDGKQGVAVAVDLSSPTPLKQSFSWGNGIDSDRMRVWLAAVISASSHLPEFKSENDPLGVWRALPAGNSPEDSSTVRQALRFLVAASIRLSNPPDTSDGTASAGALQWLLEAMFAAQKANLPNATSLLFRVEQVSGR